MKDKLTLRLGWLIRLRWIAIIGVFLTVFIVHKIFKIPLQIFPIYITLLILFIYNIINFFLLKKLNLKSNTIQSIYNNRFANFQISLDFLFLSFLIHFSGGVENPFIFYFVFHMIIASILLTRRASFLQATFAIGLFSLIILLEYSGYLPHYNLEKFLPYSLYRNLFYVFGVWFVFMSTSYIAVYMTTSISKQLKMREKSLHHANKLLQEKDRIKSEYVLRVTHDIKGDLSSIHSCIQPVLFSIGDRLKEEQKDLLIRASQRIKKVLCFVNELLEITRIKLKKGIEKEVFLLSEVLNEILKDMKEKAKNKNISFNVAIDNSSMINMKGVKVYIKEAILNILDNAIKYTIAGGEISFILENRPAVIWIQIRDTGIGIPRQELSFIFDEFYRGSNAKEIKKHSTGLGLSLVKEIVDMHEGRVKVESEEKKGTTFILEFPK